MMNKWKLKLIHKWMQKEEIFTAVEEEYFDEPVPAYTIDLEDKIVVLPENTHFVDSILENCQIYTKKFEKNILRSSYIEIHNQSPVFLYPEDDEE